MLRSKFLRRGLGAAMCCLFVLAAFLTACDSADNVQPERVSDEELVRLREAYPYNDESGTADLVVREQFEEIRSPLFNYHAVVVLKLEDTFVGQPQQISPLGEGEQLPGMTTTLTGVFGSARVEKVLWGEPFFSGGDAITLTFGSTAAVEMMDTLSSFYAEQRYVCFLSEPKTEGSVTYYPTTKSTGFFLTENDVVLCMTSEPGPDSASGLYLPAFEALVNATLGDPNAVPELKTE